MSNTWSASRPLREAMLFLMASAAFAQNTGAISGVVVDLAGDPVASAPVQATNVSTKAVYKATSSPAGQFTVASLPAGTYEIVVDALGFNRFVQQNVAIAAGKTLRLDIHMVDYQFNTLGDGREIRVALLTEHATPKGPAPRTADGKPDLSGMWHPLRVTDPGKPELLPWAASLFKQRTDNNTKDSPFSQCLPRGVALVGGLYPFKAVQTPSEIILLFEDWVPSHREIFMDGRAHTKDLYTWMGHAVGHWEQDTLVVDRAGFNDTSWIDTSGRPHTDKLHVIERFRRPDLGHLEVEMTFDDPGAYAKPWTMKGVYDYAGDPAKDEIQEFICNENNKDLGHMVGR
ncbi:MAG TPA: carboxypeptidase-like regulatory domain-containing protein [Bryobacteraceae bacterium]|nr:carboxypeptidase-like regulatory domain-containing protein [Bryobacteraceae bacterium]